MMMKLYMKIIHVYCGVKNYLKEDHRSYIHNLCSCVYNCDDLPSNNIIINAKK